VPTLQVQNREDVKSVIVTEGNSSRAYDYVTAELLARAILRCVDEHKALENKNSGKDPGNILAWPLFRPKPEPPSGPEAA